MSLDAKPPYSRGLLKHGLPPAVFSTALAARNGVRHGFFGREGGVSTGIYASLNAGTGSKDAPAAVTENRRRIANNFSLTLEQMIGVHQVHSPIAHFVDRAWPGARPEGDALVTTTPRLALSILTADCTPVLFADTDAGVIGAAHAGWKGALGGVLEATVARMREAGARNILAAIGPTIGRVSYEVGPEFEARFLEACSANRAFFSPGAGDRRHFDLPAFCAARLGALNIRVSDVGLDTCTEEKTLFSNRRAFQRGEPDYGRNCSVIMLD